LSPTIALRLGTLWQGVGHTWPVAKGQSAPSEHLLHVRLAHCTHIPATNDGAPKRGASLRLGFRFPAVESAERRQPTGRERMVFAFLQTLQEPILLLPWVCSKAENPTLVGERLDSHREVGMAEWVGCCRSYATRRWFDASDAERGRMSILVRLHPDDSHRG
jgi:hypothetical protein